MTTRKNVERLLDEAENVMLEAIENGNLEAAEFLLSNRGRLLFDSKFDEAFIKAAKLLDIPTDG